MSTRNFDPSPFSPSGGRSLIDGKSCFAFHSFAPYPLHARILTFILHICLQFYHICNERERNEPGLDIFLRAAQVARYFPSQSPRQKRAGGVRIESLNPSSMQLSQAWPHDEVCKLTDCAFCKCHANSGEFLIIHFGKGNF